jgi:hypothetical protein
VDELRAAIEGQALPGAARQLGPPGRSAPAGGAIREVKEGDGEVRRRALQQRRTDAAADTGAHNSNLRSAGHAVAGAAGSYVCILTRRNVGEICFYKKLSNK